MSKVSRAVKRAAKKAEKIHAEVYGVDDDTTDDPDAILDGLNDPAGDGDAATKPQLEIVPAVEAPAAGKPDSDGAGDVQPPAEPAAQTPVDGPAAEPVVDPALELPADPVVELTAELEKANHKYSVLQGMHRKILDDFNDLRREVDAMRAAPAAPVEASPLESRAVTDTDVEDYGSEMISMVKRAAEEQVSPQLAALKQENDELKAQITGVTSDIDTRAKDDIYSTLTQTIPNWEQINRSDEFTFWLAQQDPFSGQRRQDLITQAFQTNDSARVAKFFNAFLNENTAVATPQPVADPAPTPTPKVDLVSMAAPGRAQSGGKPSNQADTRVYSRAEISQHYKNVQIGKFKGTEADKLRIEKAFVSAANEGRVT